MVSHVPQQSCWQEVKEDPCSPPIFVGIREQCLGDSGSEHQVSGDVVHLLYVAFLECGVHKGQRTESCLSGLNALPFNPKLLVPQDRKCEDVLHLEIKVTPNRNDNSAAKGLKSLTEITITYLRHVLNQSRVRDDLSLPVRRAPGLGFHVFTSSILVSDKTVISKSLKS